MYYYSKETAFTKYKLALAVLLLTLFMPGRNKVSSIKINIDTTLRQNMKQIF